MQEQKSGRRAEKKDEGVPGPHAAAEGGETLQLLGVEGEQASNLLPPLMATLILLLLGLIN